MSGRYPMRDGLQQYVIRSMAAYGMPLDVQTIPEHLRHAGYTTHLLGSVHIYLHHSYQNVEVLKQSSNSKWHLGYFDPAYTPNNRGFDSFIGYYGDKEEYYMKVCDIQIH